MAITTITLMINVDSQYINDFVETIAAYLGWIPTITNSDGTTSPNPVSALDYDRQKVIDYLTDCFTAQKTQETQQAAQSQLKQELDTLASSFSSTVSQR